MKPLEPKTQNLEAKDNKDKGWFGIINEKLTEWPLWNKITSLLIDPPKEEAKK